MNIDLDKPILRVLLVEDSIATATFISGIFRQFRQSNLDQSVEMHHVERLSDAIAAGKHQNFDVALLDLSLPDSHGLDTLNEFKAVFPNCPVVVLTTSDDDKLAIAALTAGAQDYLIKNKLSPLALIRTIRFAIERGHILQKLRVSEQALLLANAEGVIALERERELNQLKSTFIATVSHEFRTPLTTILMAADLLQDPSKQLTQEKKSKRFERIRTSVSRMEQLIDDMMLIATSGSAKLDCNTRPIDLERFCLDLIETLIETLPVSEAESNVVFSYQGVCQAEMDKSLLQHIFTNLLSNALKYSAQGSTVEFDLLCGSGVATFKINDRGIGIPAADIDQLFQIFHRASNVGNVKGTGLGLSIVKRCVDAHRGEIDVISEEGVGSTFIVRLPLNPQVSLSSR